uniref:Beta-defensin n=1 Tax=Ornithorhynchus anatinus TaxID=9258 RepID=A0A6Q7HR13_ORNAN
MNAHVLLLCTILFLLVHTPPALGGMKEKCVTMGGYCRKQCRVQDALSGYCRNENPCCVRRVLMEDG